MPLLNGMKDRLLCVRGNCDAEVDQMVLEFPVLADYAVLPVADGWCTLPTAMSTTPRPRRRWLPATFCCTGTPTSRRGSFGQGSLYLNPGSVSLPKEAAPTAT